MKRWIALLLTAALLLALLPGCGKKNRAEEFYALGDEIAAVQDAQISLTIPYHGATLLAEGFVSRTQRRAELKLSFAGTDGWDGVWSELRVIDSDLWLNVGQMSRFTCDAPLTEERRLDILELSAPQSAAWLHYAWEGDFWAGISGWKELLGRFWQDSREDLSGSISQQGDNAYVLTLDRAGLDKQGAAVAGRLTEQKAALAQGFTDTMDQQIGLGFALPVPAGELFERLWSTVLRGAGEETGADEPAVVDLDGDGEQVSVPEETPEPLKSVKLTLSRREAGYGVELRHDGQQVFDLTLTPGDAPELLPPEDVMDFEDYYHDVYYLVTLSRGYLVDILEGVQIESEHVHETEEPVTEPLVYPMTTVEAQGYEGIALIHYLSESGEGMPVPVLTGYTSNTVTSENNDGEMINQLSLYHPHWDQQVYTLAAENLPEEDVAQEVEEYYDIFIFASGYQVMEDISPVTVSGDGACVAQGFSYQEDAYSSAMGKLVVLMRQKDAKAYTVLDFKLDLDEMTDGEQEQLRELFRYLGLEIPIMLRIA